MTETDPALDPNALQPITQWMAAAHDGDEDALAQLYEAVYPILHRMALRRQGFKGDGTLRPTAVISELFLKLSESAAYNATNRAHFFAICSRAMRYIVTDAARRALAQKRGGEHQHYTLDTALAAHPDRSQELLDISSALDDLDELDPALRQLVELRFYGGLTFHELTEFMDRSERSLKRDWAKARAFLVARSASQPT